MYELAPVPGQYPTAKPWSELELFSVMRLIAAAFLRSFDTRCLAIRCALLTNGLDTLSSSAIFEGGTFFLLRSHT